MLVEVGDRMDPNAETISVPPILPRRCNLGGTVRKLTGLPDLPPPSPAVTGGLRIRRQPTLWSQDH